VHLVQPVATDSTAQTVIETNQAPTLDTFIHNIDSCRYQLLEIVPPGTRYTSVAGAGDDGSRFACPGNCLIQCQRDTESRRFSNPGPHFHCFAGYCCRSKCRPEYPSGPIGTTNGCKSIVISGPRSIVNSNTKISHWPNTLFFSSSLRIRWSDLRPKGEIKPCL
jgi:hypothetical protein